jgi:hypothetical protein
VYVVLVLNRYVSIEWVCGVSIEYVYVSIEGVSEFISEWVCDVSIECICDVSTNGYVMLPLNGNVMLA